MDVDRNLVDLVFLISRWSSYFHTFVAAWGEFCSSLEDVFMLTGLPVPKGKTSNFCVGETSNFKLQTRIQL